MRPIARVIAYSLLAAAAIGFLALWLLEWNAAGWTRRSIGYAVFAAINVGSLMCLRRNARRIRPD